MLTQQQKQAIMDYAREPGITLPSLRRFVELTLESADRALGHVAHDGKPRERFGDPEAAEIAERVWGAVHSPLRFFEGKPYEEGLAAYKAAKG